MPATLFIVATPIGNLGDITIRAIETLKSVDLILCEDTRVTRRLLDHYNIDKPTISYHEHSKLKKTEYIARLLEEGKDLALVSDAGTPGISDPGNKLIAALVGPPFAPPSPSATEGRSEASADKSDLKIISIPGPSAVTASLSISGFNTNKFIFMGFPPVKNKRKKFFEEIKNSKYPVVFYESPHRILKTIKELPARNIVVCRELTKKFESIYRGTPDEVLKKLSPEEVRGEFVIIVSSAVMPAKAGIQEI